MDADWPVVPIRFGLYAALGGTFGLSVFALHVLEPDERGDALPLLTMWLAGSAAVGFFLSIAWLVVIASTMAGASIWPPDRAAIAALLTGPATGTAWIVRMIASGIAGIVASCSTSRSGPLAAIAVASAVALATLAWMGHGAMDDGAIGRVHLAADMAHLLAAGAWLGALLGLVLLVLRPAHRVDASHLLLTHRALRAFAPFGTIVVGTILFTGIVNGWRLVGGQPVSDLAATLYGRLLIAKLALFLAMLGLAALNRFRFAPRFAKASVAADHGIALAALRRSIGIETACAMAMLGLVAWLGTLDPQI